MRVLECGSIPLMLTLALKTDNYNVTGMDIEPSRYSSVIEKEELKVIRCEIETERFPFPDEYFDAVLFNELFEHLRINPLFTMREVRRVLKHNGLLIMSTPNLRSLSGIINFILLNKSYSVTTDIFDEYNKLEKLGHMGHVREYTSSEIITFLKKLGFRVDLLIYRGGYNGWHAKFVRLFPSLSQFLTYLVIKDN
jgi:SAM-dependent methyltransferase